MKKILNVAILLCGFAGATLSVPAQTAVPPPMPNYQPLSDQQLDQLLGPIALYPDPLIAEILPASTLPTQIVLADRYVAGGGDPSQIDQQPWDASVQALAHYPSVLKWMDDNLNWTTTLGDAFLNQQQDVMDSIQRLRASAQNLGNLQSTPQQQVVDDSGNLEIVPADPQVIYVPVYDPDVVFYQSPFGSPFITFGIGFAIGGWLNCDFDWGHRNLIVWNHNHPRPANWWHERGNQHSTALADHTTVWHPANHPGVGTASRGDRGWNNPVGRRPAQAMPRPSPNGIPPRNVSGARVNGNDSRVINPPNHIAGPPARVSNMPGPAPVAPMEHFAPISRPPTSGAFIGIQSSQDARTFSNRGEQSMETITHSEPVSRPAPSFSGGGGGGGGGGGHQRR